GEGRLAKLRRSRQRVPPGRPGCPASTEQGEEGDQGMTTGSGLRHQFPEDTRIGREYRRELPRSVPCDAACARLFSATRKGPAEGVSFHSCSPGITCVIRACSCGTPPSPCRCWPSSSWSRHW